MSMNPNAPISPPIGPATGSFNGLHHQSNVLAVVKFPASNFTRVMACAAWMLLGTTVALPQITEQKATQAVDPLEGIFFATLVIIKQTLSKKIPQVEFKEMNAKASKLFSGNNSRSFERFSSNKIGWIIKSNGIELQCVIINYEGDTPKNAEYLEALVPFSEAQKMHEKHIKILSSSCKVSANGKYDIGDGYAATVKLFKGSTGFGRTVLHIEPSK